MWAESIAKSFDQAARSSFYRPDSPKGRVYQQHTALFDADGVELPGHLGLAQLILLDLRASVQEIVSATLAGSMNLSVVSSHTVGHRS
jgi:hypothetical protein